MFEYIVFGITYAFAAAVQPGPFQTFIISQTLSHGWKKTWPAAFAPLLSDGPIILLVLLVLSQLPGVLINILQLIGGVFLLYLAYDAFKTWRKYDDKDKVKNLLDEQTLLKATLVNLLNPNPYIGWSLIMGPLLIQGWREAPVNGIALLIGFYTTMVISTFGIILVFAGASNIGPKISKVLIGLSALALSAFGFYQLWQGIGKLL